MSSNADVLRAFFAAFTGGDVAAIEHLLSPDARSHTPGNSLLAGHRSGRDEVLAHLGRSGELSGGTYRLEMLDVLDGEHHAAAVYRGTAEREGRSLDVVHVALYAIADGRITEAWFTPLDQDRFDEFWS
jgi:ketosteroid isomerase-like protein